VAAHVHQPALAQTQEQRLQQILAPQLRQSLEILQTPLLELQTLLRQQLEQNPVLEERVEPHETIEVELPTPIPDEGGGDEDIRRLAELDDAWRELHRWTGSRSDRSVEEEQKRHQRLLDSLTRQESLQDHMLRQLALSDLDAGDRKIAELLIGSLNDDGLLNVTTGELAETSGLPLERIEAVLRKVQEFDPPGIAARDLRECLAIQLARRGLGGGVAARIVDAHLHDLAREKYREIAEALGVPVAEVYEAARLISTLDPRPGRDFGEPPIDAVPDATITRSGDGYVVTLNNERLPRLRISRQYRKLLEDPATPESTREYIRDKIRAAEALIRGLHQRQDTLAAIAREIVERQRDFFERGPEGLRPLTMAEVAAKLAVHQTTVSRAVAGKYLDTPQGLLPMRFFFSTGYHTASGQDVSNRAVKERIREMIAAEDLRSPLSDDAIARRLAEQGVPIARRTVAKYREEMGIPPSHQRRG